MKAGRVRSIHQRHPSFLGFQLAKVVGTPDERLRVLPRDARHGLRPTDTRYKKLLQEQTTWMMGAPLLKLFRGGM